MIQAKILMGMPIILEIVDQQVSQKDFDEVYKYFEYVDNKFSTYKNTSEISKINQGSLKPNEYSEDMKEVFRLCDETKKATNGYFDIIHNNICDPSGLVKGWSIFNAAKILQNKEFKNFYVDAGGDVQIAGKNSEGNKWSVGIRNPFNYNEIVKVLYVQDLGVATSGTYARGLHIYNPKNDAKPADEIASITVVGPNIYEADRFATAAFAMGTKGIQFIESLKNFEGYMIDKKGIATYTSNFEKYTQKI